MLLTDDLVSLSRTSPGIKQCCRTQQKNRFIYNVARKLTGANAVVIAAQSTSPASRATWMTLCCHYGLMAAAANRFMVGNFRALQGVGRLERLEYKNKIY